MREDCNPGTRSAALIFYVRSTDRVTVDKFDFIITTFRAYSWQYLCLLCYFPLP